MSSISLPERGLVTDKALARCLSPRRLELTILPTEKCNFRCTYCYEDFATGRMKPHIVEGVKNLISARSTDVEELYIGWFGGEPLLAPKVILNISAHALELSQRVGFKFSGGLTTNAYNLSIELLESLVRLNQQFFQITLDGWEEEHDKTRRRADGKGTFKKIWINLCQAHNSKLDFKIVFRIHLTDSNQESLERLCFEIGQEFLNDDRFNQDFQDVRNLGGDGGSSVVALDASSFKSRVNILKQYVVCGREGKTFSSANIKRTNFTGSRKSPPNEQGRSGFKSDDAPPYICYASKLNFFLIRANGKIGKCTVALNDRRNMLGHINPDGTIELDQDLVRQWSNGLETLDISQLACPIRHVKLETKADRNVLQIPTMKQVRQANVKESQNIN